MDLHPDCEPIAFLLGTWEGRGRGHYPTIEPFEYRERIEFTHAGKPFLAYTQKTFATDDGRPLHAEAGYWRPKPEGRIELVLAHPTGICEIEEGTIDGRTIRLSTTHVTRTSSAVRVEALAREFVAEGDMLRYTVAMDAVGVGLTPHLEAELHKV